MLCRIRLLLLLAASFVLTPGIGLAQQPGQQPRSPEQAMQVLAVVNGQQITRDEVAQQALRRFGEMVIESVINNQLILAECQKQGIQVTADDVTQELERRAKKFGRSVESYVELIRSERGIDEHKLRNEVIWTKLALQRLAASRIEVTEDQIATRMQSDFGPRVQVRAIALASENEARQILAQAQANPEQFSRLAMDHSIDPQSASVGGLLPPFFQNMDEPVLEQAAFALQPGQLSPVIQMADQFIVLKCERTWPARELTREQEVLARQRIKDELRDSNLEEAAEALFKHMQETSEIVNVINDPELRGQMPGVAAMVNGQRITLDYVREECLRQFGADVLASEISRTLIMQQMQEQGVNVTDEDLQKEIARAAAERGFVAENGTPDVQRWMQFVTNGDDSAIEVYVNDEVWPTVAMKKLVSRTVQVTEEDLQRGFEANFGPRVRCLAIVLDDQRSAQLVWDMARQNPTEQYFGELAHQYSIEPASRANYGEVPPIQMHGGRKVLEEEAFRLQPGEISGLIPVGEHWIVLWCKGRTNPVVQDYDVVKDELYRDILEKKLRIAMAEEFERLQTTAQVDNFLVGTSQPGADQVRAARSGMQQAPQR